MYRKEGDILIYLYFCHLFVYHLFIHILRVYKHIKKAIKSFIKLCVIKVEQEKGPRSSCHDFYIVVISMADSLFVQMSLSYDPSKLYRILLQLQIIIKNSVFWFIEQQIK